MCTYSLGSSFPNGTQQKARLVANRPLASPPPLPTTDSCRRKRYRLDLERLNFRRRSVYLTDLYHTLVNCHW